jgi:diguanylate cyclase (GGDEF)-like protein
MLVNIVSFLKTVLSPPDDNPELLQAKFAAFSRQVPIMYALVVLNTLALAVTHYGRAPDWLTLYLPGVLDAICIWRTAMWWRSRHRTISFEQAIRRLRSTIALAGLLGAGFSAWSLSLFSYGDAYMQGQVAFFMGVTAIGCGFCLMHLRSAALLVMALVVVPFTAFLGSSGNVVLASIAINFVIVAIAVTFMLLTNYSEFEQRVNSGSALRAKQAELQAMSDTNLRNSNTDILTGLPNRRHFFAELERRMAVAAADPANKRLRVGIIDLDGFKPINDVHGHLMGDRLLIAVAKRLRARLDPAVFLARLGGDEFVLISDRVTDRQAAVAARKLLIDIFEAPFEIDDLTVRIGCSIGYAEFPKVAKSAEDLFERADYALFYAKQHDRGGIVGFSAVHEATIREASVIDQALMNADLERELWIAYQPIVDAKTFQTVTFEALARWKSPALGNVPPIRFIVAAERSGLIAQLTPMLLRKALEGAATWPEQVRISFNLSAVDLTSPLSILKIISVVENSGVKPSRIDFEITETAVMGNLALATESLNALKALGARISLDDFGTGYSSLSCIRELPLDKVKIDRSFITKIEDDPAACLILRTMIGLCTGLGYECIVEGVETHEQAQFLRTEGCRFMQGYFFAKPMRVDRVRDYIAASNCGALQLEEASGWTRSVVSSIGAPQR